MKRLSIILIVALLAGMVGGCRFALIETDSVRVSTLVAHAEEEEEGLRLFEIETPDLSALDDIEQAEIEKIDAYDATGEDGAEALEAPDGEVLIGLHSRDAEGENKVRKLQERLVDLGYLSIEPDGVFGSRTLKALKRFQHDNNLKQTGVLDEATKEVLYPRPEVTTAPGDVKYSLGDSGADIRILQRKLRQYGFTTRVANGEFDEDTYDEVMAFQQYAVSHYGTEFDDPVEETVAQATPTPVMPQATPTPYAVEDIPEMPALAPEATLRPHHALDGVVSHNLYDYLTSDRFPVYYDTVARGNTGEEVMRLQRRLVTLDYFYEDPEGEYDEATQQAVESFQKRNGLQQTGIADQATQQALFSDTAVEAEQVEKPFYIKVSIDDQRVYVYRWADGGYNQLIKTMICSTGFGNSTPKGVFVSPGHRDARWHYFGEFHCWAQYAFIIKGSILFHSVIFSRKDEASLRQSTLRKLGHKASHGCVRLKVEDAKWIYDHCSAGQVIEVY